MNKRNFVVTVKEQEAGEPCFLLFEAYDDIGIGIGDKKVTFYLPKGTSIAEAEELADCLNAGVAKIAVTD